MALYAFKDKERKDIIYASDAIVEDRNKNFYCPNPSCTAHLYVCAIDGSKQAYFRATKHEFKHIKGCSYARSDGFNRSEYDEEAFDFDSAIEKLFSVTNTQKARVIANEHGTGEPKKNSLRTLRQLYYMCKSIPVNDRYGEKQIGDMLLDERSLYRYPRGCFGNRIIEAYANGKFYDNGKQQIYIIAPIVEKQYSFILQFRNQEIYKTIRKEIFNNKENIIVVAGNWKSSGSYNCFLTEVVGRKQVSVIKD